MSHRFNFSGGFTPCLLVVATVFLGAAPSAVAQVGSCIPAVGEAYLDVSNVRARILNNGSLFYRGEPHVYEVPKGGGATAIFNGGLWVGGLVDGELRVASSRYGPWEFWAGPLDDDGNPPDDCSIFDKIWTVNVSDVELYDEGNSPTLDLAGWPTGLGAPTVAPAADDGEDNNGDGSVDEEGEVKEIHKDILQQPLAERIDRVIDLEAGERPAIIGDQMLWWIMNDRGNVHNHSDTPPIGLEVHGMAFALDQPGDIGNMTFYKANLYYKGSDPFEAAYVSLWSDPDLGDFLDDYVGSDTTLGMGFVYNADNFDGSAQGYGEAPPALGYDLFQGPIVPSPGDTAYVSGDPVPDFRNLGMTSFMRVVRGTGPMSDPADGPHVYSFMQGLWRDSSAIQVYGEGHDEAGDPPETKYMFPGDPVSGQFWSEVNSDGQGTSIEPWDRRFVMSSGPFTMNPGDHQEIVYGIVWARGIDNLDSITQLRSADVLAQALADADFEIGDNVSTQELLPGKTRARLFPNPVAELLRIETVDGFRDGVEITVHDLLGRTVARESRGAHEGNVRLDVSLLPAGRYFVRLKAGRQTETHLVVKR